MSYGSPYSSGTPLRGDPGYYYDVNSPSPTPSPHHYQYYPAKTPQRPATRAHHRGASNGNFEFRPTTAFSPRYTSTGEYATGPNPKGFPTYHEKADHPRYEDIPARSATRVGHHPPPPSSRGHSRRPSEAVTPNIARSATAKPSMQQKKTTPVAKATEADARKHKIPTGYSLKNWDPSEEPIMLLGSVFDANSLGKWIYDWTVYTHGPSKPMSDMAGDLWLLLIQLAGKVKRSEDVVPRVRAKENRELVEDFISSGERLMDKLRSLLKRCETPMLKASKRKESAQLGKNSGTEFVETLFGSDRELEKTEKFMQAVRLWNLRFDANCEEILKKPTA